MKTRISIALLIFSVCCLSCKPTYTFLANNSPNSITHIPNVRVNVKRLNRFDSECRRTGWWIVNSPDSTLIAKYKNGMMDGRVLVIDECYQVFQKYRMKHGICKGLVVTYNPSFRNKWMIISYYDRFGNYEILRKIRPAHGAVDPCDCNMPDTIR